VDRPFSTLLSRAVLGGLLPLADRRLEASRQPYDGTPEPVPHADSRLWAWTHFGVFVPLLPEPHRYLNTMTLIGATGAELFDNDPMVGDDAREFATVLSSTAQGDEHHYRGYDFAECAFEADGSSLAWGDHLTIEVALPVVRVAGRYESFEVDLELAVTDRVSYFIRSPIYQHFSLLAPFTGTIRDARGETAVSGLGTFEYARALGHQSLSSKALPVPAKLPLDFFTYQVIQLDERTQLLLTEVTARGSIACRLAHVRTTDGPSEVHDDVTFEVVSWDEPRTDPWGRTMPVPAELRWRVRDAAGDLLLDLEGKLDAPWRFGHGRGYVSAYSYAGHFRGRPVEGSAYIEWVDVRAS